LAAGAHLQATYYQGSGLVPKEITQLAEDLHRQQLIQHLDETVVSIREQAARAGQLLGSMQQLIGDQKMRQDLQTAVTNVRTASESAARVGQSLEKFSGNLQHVTDQTSQTMSEVRVAAVRLGSVLDHFDSIAGKMDQGKGTAGMLVNDPKLYQGLVDSTKQLNLTIADLQRVVQQWEQEGVTLKLGK
jgi:phospholipid/cholesterol/gamma-HCH transport system substrate-binding protein